MTLSNQMSFAMPAGLDRWPERMDEACSVLEAVFPGEKLSVAFPYRDDQDPVHVPDRPKYFRAKLRTRTRWFSIGNGKVHRGFGAAMSDEGMLSVGGGIDALMIMFPLCDPSICETLIERVGDAVQAHHAQWSPSDTFLWLRWVQWGHQAPQGIESVPHDLPQLQYSRRDVPEQPEILGWLNYWSKAACEYIGALDAVPGSDVPASFRRTPSGAQLVKLGAQPLDYRLFEHRASLSSMYRLFPRIGVRR